MTAPFVIFSLPRSRSTWLSVLLSRPGRLVGHDIGIESASAKDFVRQLGVGTCETGAAFAWPLIRRMVPEVKFAVVLRSAHEVAESLKRQGLGDHTEEMRERQQILHEIVCLPGTLTLPYEDLGRYIACDELTRFCLGHELEYGWWEKMRNTNVQVDLGWQMSRLWTNRDRIEALKAEVRRELVHV